MGLTHLSRLIVAPQSAKGDGATAPVLRVIKRDTLVGTGAAATNNVLYVSPTAVKALATATFSGASTFRKNITVSSTAGQLLLKRQRHTNVNTHAICGIATLPSHATTTGVAITTNKVLNSSVVLVTPIPQAGRTCGALCVSSIATGVHFRVRRVDNLAPPKNTKFNWFVIGPA